MLRRRHTHLNLRQHSFYLREELVAHSLSHVHIDTESEVVDERKHPETLTAIDPEILAVIDTH